MVEATMRSVLTVTTWFPSEARPEWCVFNKNVLDELARLGRSRHAVISPVPYLPQWVRIFAPSEKKYLFDTPKVASDSRYTVYYPRYLKIPFRWNYQLYLRSILKTIQENKLRAEIIHAHGILPDGRVAVMLGDRFKIPVVLHVHESATFDAISAGYGLEGQAVLREVDAIIAVSEHQRKLLEQKFGLNASKIFVAENGVSLSRFRYQSQDFKPTEMLRFVSVGYLTDRKGFHTLLSAYAILKRNGIRFKAEIIGDGPDANRYRRLSHELDLAKEVKFLGVVDNSDLPKILRQSHFFVLPTRDESFGIAFVEAMACGLPVIATSVPALRDLVPNERIGLLVPSDDPKALTGALSDAMSMNWDRKAISEHASRYSIEATALKIDRVYDHVQGIQKWTDSEPTPTIAPRSI
jgi:glycosyltransferase involved in cell wall biosynthesis